jgi:AsmA protein
MKKLVVIIGSVVALIVVALLVIPMVVNVDKYRPQIVAAANEKMNGSLEIGKLSLSLWGHIHIAVDGLKISDAQKKQIVAVKDASFDSSFGSIFSGAPLVTISMKEPEISVIKNKDGKLNVMSLLKDPGTASASKTSAVNAAASKAPPGQAEVPSMIVNSHIGISIENAKFTYIDQTMALSNTIDNLNVRVKDFSLTRKTELEIWADLKTQMGSDLKVDGPLKFTADFTPEISNGEFKSGTVNASFSADDLAIQKGELFQKKKGVPANLKISATLDQTAMKLTNVTAKFHNAEMVVKGVYDKNSGADIHFETKPVDLKPWNELVPMLTQYELEGKLTLSGDVKGKPEALQYNAKLTVQDLSAKGPNLKAKPVINASIDVTTDKIDRLLVDLKGPGNELVLNAKLVSFTKPVLTFQVTSPKGMDLDQWIEFPKPQTAKEKAQASKNAAAQAPGENGAEVNLDAMVDPIRKNEMIRNMVVDGSVSLAFLKAMNVRIDDIAVKIQFKNLVAALSGLKMKLFDGTVAGGFSTDLKPAQPLYNMNLAITGLDISKAVETQFQSFKDTLSGKLSFSALGGGSSFNAAAAKQHLKMKGEFKILNAQFKTINVAKMANDAINGSIGKISDKVPFLKGKNLQISSKVDSTYDSVTGHFTINNGKLDVPDFFAKAAPKRGIDLKGATEMGLIDESLNANWQLIDTQHVTGADQLSVNIAGKEYKNFLAKSVNDPVIIPVSVGCKWSAPCPNYSAAPEYLAGVAASRLNGVARDVVKSKAIDAVKNALPGLKNLFGH